MRKLLIFLTILLVISFAALPGLAEETSYKFYMITHCQPADVFWSGVYAGMEDAAKLLGVEAIYLGSKVSGDIGEMVTHLELALAASPNGIAISITDAHALDPLLRKAIEMGIPIVAINVGDPRPPEEKIPYLIYIGEDSYLSGVRQAEAILKVFSERYGRPPIAVVYASHEPGNIVQEIRARGVIDTVKAAGTTKAEIIDVTYDPAKIHETLRAYLEANPGVEYIATGNSAVASWVVDLLTEIGKLGNLNEPPVEGQVYVAGIDVDLAILEHIKEGKVIATIDQQQYLQGYFGILLLYLWNEGMYIPGADISTGPFVIDQTNVDRIYPLVKEKGWH